MRAPSKAATAIADELAHMRHGIHEERLSDAMAIIVKVVERVLEPERRAADMLAERVRWRVAAAVPEWAPELREALREYEETQK